MKKLLPVFVIFFASFALAECSTAGDCRNAQICVEGQCLDCSAENAGLKCSDDTSYDFENDGICTYDGKCQESTVCKNSLTGNLFSSCISCQSGDLCAPKGSGGFLPKGICFEEKCQTQFCVSNFESYPQICGPEGSVCEPVNEGKFCDSVFDGNFFPEGKTCLNEKCILSGAVTLPDRNPELAGTGPVAAKGEMQSGIDLMSFIFGPVYQIPIEFFSMAILSILLSILCFPYTRQYFADENSTTRQKQYAIFLRLLFGGFVFALPFQLARFFGFHQTMLLLVVSIISVSMVGFYKAKIESSRKAIRV